MDIYWPGMLILLYALCGLGFTIQGFFALGEWRAQKSNEGKGSAARVD